MPFKPAKHYVPLNELSSYRYATKTKLLLSFKYVTAVVHRYSNSHFIQCPGQTGMKYANRISFRE